MVILVVGTPDSGKSGLAEDIVCNLADNESRVYLATMIAYDEAGRERIERHKNKRLGKEFVTLEIPYGIDKVVNIIENPKDKTVLLECISNLAGNEMYENKTDTDVVTRIIDEVKALSISVKNLVIVTNKFEIEETYDAETVKYIDVINKVNEQLVNLADDVRYV